jgi:hypothetical protein
MYFNLRIFIVLFMYSYCMFMSVHRASWHSSATLTEVSPCFFLSSKKMPGYNSQRRSTARTLPKIFVLLYVLFVLCRSVYCLCVKVYCTTATGWQPNCSLTNISYISYQYQMFRDVMDQSIEKKSLPNLQSINLARTMNAIFHHDLQHKIHAT